MLVTNKSCSLPCFKVHKETCQLKLPDAAQQKETNILQETKEPDDRPLQRKLVKEYNLVSAGQLAILRRLSHLSSTDSFAGTNKELIELMNSPELQPFLRNLLSGIPKSVDLSEMSIETSTSLDKALSLLHEIRTEEVGPITSHLETLIDRIYMVSGEYHP